VEALAMTARTKKTTVFAIVRVDSFHHADASPEETITIKKIVWEQATAVQEVERLNQLNASKGARYFWQMAHLDSAPSLESDEPAAGATDI
jgi:hypothetical protein